MLPLALPGLPELSIIALVLVMLFGATKLPALARSMGSSINQFKKGLKDEEDPRLSDSDGQEKPSE